HGQTALDKAGGRDRAEQARALQIGGNDIADLFGCRVTDEIVDRNRQRFRLTACDVNTKLRLCRCGDKKKEKGKKKLFHVRIPVCRIDALLYLKRGKKQGEDRTEAVESSLFYSGF